MSGEIERAHRLAWTRLLAGINEKTSWGKNELKDLMNQLLNDALAEIADQEKD